MALAYRSGQPFTDMIGEHGEGWHPRDVDTLWSILLQEAQAAQERARDARFEAMGAQLQQQMAMRRR